MNKILFSADPDINYVFHMLSVAKCGYDNAYGEKCRGRYDSADMKCRLISQIRRMCSASIAILKRKQICRIRDCVAEEHPEDKIGS